MDYSGLVGIYLAAGKSSRMGSPKVNLPLGNRRLGSIALRAALKSKLDVTIAITRKGESLQWLTPFSKSEDLRIVECVEADRGQSASLRAGAKVAAEMGAAGVVVLLADQPFVTTKMINRLIDEFHGSEEFISFSHNGVMKPPVLLASSLFPRIMKLEGDQGARSLLRSGCLGKQIKLNKDVYFFDVDTKEDYQFLLKNGPFL
ncbi:xanthine dehydrogenase [Neobacillus bataviensis LMG 21833]|uniref:Xanthine dehydrogenase n=1 Tax=Neobacillus bataviensis LMG 21833 TaxID=1117379 RepID=K6EBF2_9BACI|nr:nucleotidyltransferase family protein [Neobacillus bataviensis]EKN70761.1 xanthine dehydrogenase [Neobacillus bataviensis LMG 21833]